VFSKKMSLQKMRNGVEWTNIILKYVNEDENISEQERIFAVKLLSNCEQELKKEVQNDYEDMWKQLNKYWQYLKSIKNS